MSLAKAQQITNHGVFPAHWEPQEVTSGDMEVVARIRASLSERLGQQRYQLWFSGCQFRLSGQELQILAPTEFAQQFLSKHFAREIAQVAESVLGFAPSVEFSILVGTDSASPQATATPPRTPVKQSSNGLAVLAPPESAGAAAARGDGGAAPAPPRGARPLATLASFVVGASNQFAHLAAQRVVQEPGKQNPLLIHGPTAVGKTHLLEGICHAARQRGLKAVYQTAEQFTSMFVAAVRGTGVASFRAKYQGLDMLAIDDVQFFAGKKATMVELLHTLDSFARAGRQLVLSADRSPGGLAELGRELQSRVQAGLVCSLAPPDAALRCELAAQFARQMELSLPQEVCAYIAANLTAHIRQLQGAVNLLKAVSLTQTAPITLGVAERALAEMVQQNARPVRLADIEDVVCEVFGLEPESLRSNRKDQAVSRPRMLAMFLARKHTRAALSEIGEFFGGRKHSTVLSAQKKIANWMAQAENMQLAREACSLEEAIRRVERRLAVG